MSKTNISTGFSPGQPPAPPARLSRSPGRASPQPAAKQRRVLVIGLSNIGDAILMSDVVAAVQAWDSRAHLTLVVGERATALFAEDPRIHTLVNMEAYPSWIGRLKLALALWRYQPHVVIDLRNTLYPLLLKPLSAWRYARRPPPRLAHMRDRHWWKLTVQAPAIAAAVARPDTPSVHPKTFWRVTPEGNSLRAVRLWLAALPSPTQLRWVPGLGRRTRPGGVAKSEHTNHASAVWVSERDAAHVEGLWRRWNLGHTQRLVIICPGARSHIKRWTAEGFAQVADRLIADMGAQVIFSGEPEEEEIIESIREQMRARAYSAVGLTTIRQLGALMQRAQLVITNDSASLHLASSFAVPTVAIFGPTDAKKYGPTVPQRMTIHRRLFCAPCEQALCRFNHECMRFVRPEEVLAAAKKLLEEEVGSKKYEV